MLQIFLWDQNKALHIITSFNIFYATTQINITLPSYTMLKHGLWYYEVSEKSWDKPQNYTKTSIVNKLRAENTQK